MIVFGVRKTVTDFVGTVLFAFGWTERETRLALEQCDSFPVESDLFIFLMFGEEFAHDASNRPHLDGGVVFGLHEYDFRCAVPSTDHVRCHEHVIDLRFVEISEGWLF